MNPVEYLLTGFVTIMALGMLSLTISARQAVDGFEDDFGFHFGLTPANLMLFPSPLHTPSAYAPAESPRASVPSANKSRRKAGSKPPMLPANLDVADLNPQPTSQSKRVKKSAAQNVAPSNQAQIDFPSDQTPAS